MKFTSPAPRNDQPEPFTITIHRLRTIVSDEEGAEPQRVAEPEDITLHARADVSGTALIRVDLHAQRGRNAESVQEMFDAALTPEDIITWRDLMSDPDVFIAASTINEVGTWLYERQTNFPTPQP